MYAEYIGVALGGFFGAGAALTTDSPAVGASVATVVAGTSCLLADRITRVVADRIANAIKASLQEKEMSDDLKWDQRVAITGLIKQDLNKIAYKVLKKLDAGVKPNPVIQEFGLRVADHVMKKQFKGMMTSPFRGAIHATIARVAALAVLELNVTKAVTTMAPALLRVAVTSGVENIRSRL